MIITIMKMIIMGSTNLFLCSRKLALHLLRVVEI